MVPLTENDLRVTILERLMEIVPWVAEIVRLGPQVWPTDVVLPLSVRESEVPEVIAFRSAVSLPSVRCGVYFGCGLLDLVQCQRDGYAATSSPFWLQDENLVYSHCVPRVDRRRLNASTVGTLWPFVFPSGSGESLMQVVEIDRRKKRGSDEAVRRSVDAWFEFQFERSAGSSVFENVRRRNAFCHVLWDICYKKIKSIVLARVVFHRWNLRFWMSGDFCLQRLFCEPPCPTAPVMYQCGDDALAYLRYLVGDPTLGEGLDGAERSLEWFCYFEYVRGDF